MKPLFHGTNETYWTSIHHTLYVPLHWTTSPLEAMEHSFNNVKRHGSRLLILCIPNSREEHFKPVLTSAPYYPELDAQWYDCLQLPWTTLEDKNKHIERYPESELDKLVARYFSEKQKNFLKSKPFRTYVAGF